MLLKMVFGEYDFVFPTLHNIRSTDIAEYIRGNSSTDECEPLFKQYKSCLTVRMSNPRKPEPTLTIPQKALKERGIDTMLSEAREGTVETDSEHMRR